MQVKTQLSKDGYIINKSKFSDMILDRTRNDLTVEPYKFGISFGVKEKDEVFKVFRETDDYLSVPKFYGLEKFGEPKKNIEIKGEDVKIVFTGKLRTEQEHIINHVMPILNEKNGGLLCLGCGSGKTILALYIASVFNVKTLIIVHKSFLLNQWKERIQQFTTNTVGIIQQDKVEIDNHPFVIGMLQSIVKDKYDTDIFSDFGLVIFDEAHHAPCKYFSKALPKINSRKTLALSATPKRNDKLEKVLHWYFGPIIYKDDIVKNSTVLVKLYNYNIEHEKFKEKKQRFTGQVNRPGTISSMITIGRRNKFIIDVLEDIILEEGRKIIVLSERVEHLQLLKKRLDERNIIDSGYYIGGMKQKKLDESAKCTVIFGTFQMASEALDIKGLNTLIMATSRREIQQTIGRITRDPNSMIRPLVIDIIDNLDSFVKQGYYRRKFYRKNDFQILSSNVENNEIINEIDITNNVEITSDDEDNVDFIDD